MSRVWKFRILVQLTSWKCKIGKLSVRCYSSLISFRTQDMHLKTALRLTLATIISLSSSLLAVPSAAADSSRAVAKGDYGQRVVVSQTQNLDPLGQRIVVRGRQFNPRVGVYVALCVKPNEGDAPSPVVAASTWMLPPNLRPGCRLIHLRTPGILLPLSRRRADSK